MKVQTKIIVLICLTLFFCTAIIISIKFVENQKIEEIITERKHEQLISVKHAILSVGKSLDIFSKDYTQWDEMVDFVNNRDSVWALENIEYPLASFKINAVWVFDEKFNNVYSVNNLDRSSLESFFLKVDKLQNLLSQKSFNHFFIKIDEQLFEIRTAPIQPTSDNNRLTKPRGYFVTGKLWSIEVLEEIGSLTSSNILLYNKDDFKTDSIADIFTIRVIETLKDIEGIPLQYLTSTSSFTLLRKSKETFNIQMILGASFLFVVIFSITSFLFISINKPLKIISRSLENQNPSLLVKISKEKSEFGKLAQLIVQFFNQEEKLVDETQQRRIVETSLSKSEEKYKKIFDNVQDVFFQTDINGAILSISPSIERYSEYKPEEVLGKDITNYYLDPSTRENLLYQLQKNGEVTDFEIYFVKKKGTVIPCSINAHFLFDNENKVVGLEGSLREITERKNNEEKILKLSRAIEQSPVSVIITDTNGIIEYINPRYTLTSGYKPEELIGCLAFLLRNDNLNSDLNIEILEVIRSGKEWSGELQSSKKSGEIYWEQVLITPIKNQDNVIINYLALKEDITEKKKIVEELKTAKEKAEEMNNLKSSFLANMSHELRTPMMGILGNAEIISISSEDDEIKDMASAIYASGKRLINILNLILDLSRIEANNEALDIEKLELHSIISEVVEHFTPAAKQRGLNLNFICDKENIYSFLDERLFREILNNLINNAIKFTNVGGVTVSLKTEYDKIIIKIIDTGLGIPAHYLCLIFEEFRQVSEGCGRNFEGSGLGLTITKKFVEKLNGKISVNSVLDEGSEFTVEFPIFKEL